MIILPQKAYEIVKFIVKFIPLFVTFLGTVLLTCGAADAVVSVILTIVGAIGALAEGLIEICKANHYKIKTDEGAIIEIEAAADEVVDGREG